MEEEEEEVPEEEAGYNQLHESENEEVLGLSLYPLIMRPADILKQLGHGQQRVGSIDVLHHPR